MAHQRVAERKGILPRLRSLPSILLPLSRATGTPRVDMPNTLVETCQNGTEYDVREYLNNARGGSEQLDINGTDSEGRTALMIICTRDFSTDSKTSLFRTLMHNFNANPRLKDLQKLDVIDLVIRHVRTFRERKQIIHALAGGEVCAPFARDSKSPGDILWVTRSWMKLTHDDTEAKDMGEELVRRSTFKIHASLLVSTYFSELAEMSKGTFGYRRLSDMKQYFIEAATRFTALYAYSHPDKMTRAYLLYKVCVEPSEVTTEAQRHMTLNSIEPDSEGLITYGSQQGGMNALELGAALSASHFFSSYPVNYVIEDIWTACEVEERSLLMTLLRAFVYPFRTPLNLNRENKCWYASPQGNYFADIASYLLFISLFSFVLLSRPTLGASWLEVCMYVLSVGFIWNEIEQAASSDTIYEYIKDIWNKMDIIIFSIITGSAMCRIFGAMAPEYAAQCARMVYLSLTSIAVLVWVRILNVCSLYSRLGPMIITLGKMFEAIGNFFVICVIFLVGFTECLYGATRAMVFEEVPVDGIGFQDLLFGLARLLVADPEPKLNYDMMAELRPFFGPVILGIYMFIGWIILLNLLIAILSSAYQSVQTASEEEFNMIKSETILQYAKDAQPLPSPWNIPGGIIDMGETVLRLCNVLPKDHRPPIVVAFKNSVEAVCTISFVLCLLPLAVLLMLAIFVLRGPKFTERVWKDANIRTEWSNAGTWDIWTDWTNTRSESGSFEIDDDVADSVLNPATGAGSAHDIDPQSPHPRANILESARMSPFGRMRLGSRTVSSTELPPMPLSSAESSPSSSIAIPVKPVEYTPGLLANVSASLRAGDDTCAKSDQASSPAAPAPRFRVSPPSDPNLQDTSAGSNAVGHSEREEVNAAIEEALGQIRKELLMRLEESRLQTASLKKEVEQTSRDVQLLVQILTKRKSRALRLDL